MIALRTAIPILTLACWDAWQLLVGRAGDPAGLGMIALLSLGLAWRTRECGYLATDAVAGPYLADQLLLPFALAGGGSFTTVKPSQHSLTAADIIARFTGRRCVFEARKGESHLVTIR